MAGRPKGSVPSLVHHRPSNRARVRINGRDHWLGKWGSPEARLAYDRLMAEYLAKRRIMPPNSGAATPAKASSVTISPAVAGAVIDAAPIDPGQSGLIPDELTVAELAGLYLEHCRTYYRTADGRRTSTYDNALQAVRAVSVRASGVFGIENPLAAGSRRTWGRLRLVALASSWVPLGRPRQPETPRVALSRRSSHADAPATIAELGAAALWQAASMN